MPQFVQKLWVVNTRVVDLAFMYVYLCIYMLCICQFFIKKKGEKGEKEQDRSWISWKCFQQGNIFVNKSACDAIFQFCPSLKTH